MRETSIHYDFKNVPCPFCFCDAGRHSKRKRRIIVPNGFVNMKYGYYYCRKCSQFFRHPRVDIWVTATSKYSKSIVEMAKAIASEGGRSLEAIASELSSRTGHRIASTTVFEWLI